MFWTITTSDICVYESFYSVTDKKKHAYDHNPYKNYPLSISILRCTLFSLPGHSKNMQEL